MLSESSPSSPVRASWVLAAVLISLAATAVVWLGSGFDAAALLRFGERLSAATVLLVAALFALRLWLGGMRLRYLSGGALTRRQGLRGQLAWEFFSAVVPPVVGGGPFVAVFLARDARLRPAASTLVVLTALVYEQAWTTLSVAVVLGAALVGPVFPDTLPLWATLSIGGYLVGAALWALLLSTAVFARPEQIERLVRWTARHRWLAAHRARIEHEAADLRAQAGLLRARGLRFHATAFALTGSAWAVRYAMLVLVVSAVVPGLDVPLFVLREVAMMVTAFAVPTPGSAGGAEALYVALLGDLIRPAGMIAPTLLVWRFLNFYAFLPLGLYLSGRSLWTRRTDATDAEHAAVDTGVTSASAERPLSADAVLPERPTPPTENGRR